MKPRPISAFQARLNGALRRFMIGSPMDEGGSRLLEQQGLVERGARGLVLTPMGRQRASSMPLIVTRRRGDPIEMVLAKYAAGMGRLRPVEGKVEEIDDSPPSSSGLWLSMTDTRRWVSLARSRLDRTRLSLLTHRDTDKKLLSASRACIELSRSCLATSAAFLQALPMLALERAPGS